MKFKKFYLGQEVDVEVVNILNECLIRELFICICVWL